MTGYVPDTMLRRLVRAYIAREVYRKQRAVPMEELVTGIGGRYPTVEAARIEDMAARVLRASRHRG
jgi:hypothetical protein